MCHRPRIAAFESMAKAKVNLDDHDNHFDDHLGPSATDCDGHGAGPSVVAPEQPPAAIHSYPIPRKGAPPGPVSEPASPGRTTTTQKVPGEPIRSNQRYARDEIFVFPSEFQLWDKCHLTSRVLRGQALEEERFPYLQFLLLQAEAPELVEALRSSAEVGTCGRQGLSAGAKLQ